MELVHAKIGTPRPIVEFHPVIEIQQLKNGSKSTSSIPLLSFLCFRQSRKNSNLTRSTWFFHATNSIAAAQAPEVKKETTTAFKAHITSDPNGMLSKNWTKGTHVCNWIGISCSRRHQRVTSLDLNGLRLSGSITTEIGNLSFLSFLDIGNNSINGEIPDELGYLRRLKPLSLSMNNLRGQIPESLGLLRRLELLDLSENDLFGSVPSSIFNVSSLKVINLIYNALSGTLPNDICHNLPRLEGFYT